MGGILGYAHLAIGGDRDLCSLTTIGSALDYTGTASEFHQLRRFLPWVRRSDGLRVRLLAQALAPLAGWIDNPIERFNFWAENVSGSVVRQYAAAGIYSVPVRLLEQLATAFEAGGLKSRDGGIHYRAELTQAACPTFAIAGDQDRQCPPPAAASTVAAITRAPTLFRVYGRDHACRTSYGHFDLIVGDRAPDEVWPDIVRWLNRHDGTADPTETSLA
jgi:pimeloyl-ACP methyl ester carboxylesterase